MSYKLSSVFTLLLALASLAGCKYDNQEPPQSFITGKVVYNGEPIGVRSNNVRLELWQPGFALFQKVDIHVAQDGSFSANVFDGDYKITRLRGNGPWADQTDTISVQVRGNATVEVPVTPFFLVKDASMKKDGSNIQATFSVEKVHPTAVLEAVNLYLSNTVIVDQNNNTRNARLAANAIDPSQPITISAGIPAPTGGGRSYIYARIGVKTVGAGEQIYSSPVKINL
ncbi:MAG: DUF3823 domain-containing protein [Adhaeribacter sp.]